MARFCGRFARGTSIATGPRASRAVETLRKGDALLGGGHVLCVVQSVAREMSVVRVGALVVSEDQPLLDDACQEYTLPARLEGAECGEARGDFYGLVVEGVREVYAEGFDCRAGDLPSELVRAAREDRVGWHVGLLLA